MNLTPDQEWSLITLGIFLLLLAVWWRLRTPGKRRSKMSIVALILIFFGVYMLPAGAIDLYKLTEETFHLSYIQNYFLWLSITVSLIAMGVGVLKWRR